jgi:hypothetical protein
VRHVVGSVECRGGRRQVGCGGRQDPLGYFTILLTN